MSSPPASVLPPPATWTCFGARTSGPSTEIALTLEPQRVDEPIGASALAGALATLDDLVLVARRHYGSPIIIPLGDWSAGPHSPLDSVLRRAAFRGISVDDFRAVAEFGGDAGFASIELRVSLTRRAQLAARPMVSSASAVRRSASLGGFAST